MSVAESVGRLDPTLVQSMRIRPLRIPEDMSVVHSWVSEEYAHYWGMTGFTVAQVTDAYREIVRPADV